MTENEMRRLARANGIWAPLNTAKPAKPDGQAESPRQERPAAEHKPGTTASRGPAQQVHQSKQQRPRPR